MRLQKYLASCGVASRRAAEKLIAEGYTFVKVADLVATENYTIDNSGMQIVNKE